MVRLVRPRLLQTSRSASEDLVSESLATFRQVFCEGNPGQLWSCTSGRGFAKIPGSEPLPSSSRPKRFGTRKGLPAEEQTPSQAASGSDISAEAHASNIATLQRETAATGIRALVMQVQNQSPCLHCMASYLCWLVWPENSIRQERRLLHASGPRGVTSIRQPPSQTWRCQANIAHEHLKNHLLSCGPILSEQKARAWTVNEPLGRSTAREFCCSIPQVSYTKMSAAVICMHPAWLIAGVYLALLSLP